MTDEPDLQRFKPEMPRIPGVAGGSARGPAKTSSLQVIAILLAVLFVVGLGARFILRPKHVESVPAAPPPQLLVPTPAPDPDSLLPVASESNPVISSVAEMSKPWSSKQFIYRDRLTNENTPALLIRLASGSASQPDGYWALAMTAAYASCRLEYITDLSKLSSEYGFRAKHPMVGNPCSRTVFDPAKMAPLPGNVWVRGAIVQGSDVRPPLGIEIKIQDKNIQALRRE
jgi:hypothetical protein